VDWKAELGKLPRLQEVDLQLDALRGERQRLRAGEPWAEGARTAAARRRKAAELEARRAELEKAQRLAEREREHALEEAGRIEKRVYGGEVRNLRDLEGLQKNLQGVRERVSDLETRILEAMEALENLDPELRRAREGLAQAEEALTRQRSEGGKRLAAIEARLPGLEAERAELAAQVEAVVLGEYERARARAGGVGVARLTGGTCESCGVEVSPLVASRVRKWDRAYACENCGRILVGG
jgi:predicted  nucleic acid-binding Zn-ribbon protein